MKGSNTNAKIRFISFTASVLGIISFCLTSVPLILSIVSRSAMPLSIAIGGVFAALLLCVAIFKQRIAECILKSFMNMTSLDKPYKLLHKQITYEYLNREQMRHEKIFLVKALHNGIDHITDKFQWSGGEVYALQAKSANRDTMNEIVLMKNRSGIQTYGIFDKTGKRYCKGEIFQMGMQMELKDAERKSSPYLSSGVYEITERLTLTVLFSLDLKPVNIRKLSYIHYTDEDHYKCEANVKPEINEQGDRTVVEFDVVKPIYGGKYIIEWEFDA